MSVKRAAPPGGEQRISAKFISATAILDALYPPLHYLFYFAPVAVLLDQSGGSRIAIKISQAVFVISFVLLFCVVVLNATSLPWQAWRDLLIGIEVLILLAASGPHNERDIFRVACAFMIATVLSQLIRGGHTGSDLQIQVNLEESSGPLESKYAFPVGAILIFFVFRRSVKFAGIVAIFEILMFKRVAIAALLLVIAAMFVGSRVTFMDGFRARFLIIFVSLTSGALLSVHSIDLAEAAANFFLYDRDLDPLMMGRYIFWSETLNHYSYYSPYQMFFGTGPGTAESWLADVANGYQIHNDYLKILLEWGIVGTALIFTGFAMIFAGSKLGMYLGLYQAIIFLSDNTLIYVYHMSVLGLVLRGSNSEHLMRARASFLQRMQVGKRRRGGRVWSQ